MASKAKKAETKRKQTTINLYEDEEEEKFSSGSNSNDEKEAEQPAKAVKKPGPRKRNSTVAFSNEVDDEMPSTSSANLPGEMQKVLECLGVDVQKGLNAKRRKWQQFTQASLKSCMKKVDKYLDQQQQDRRKMLEQLFMQMNEIINDTEVDCTKLKEEEEKYQQMVLQHQKMLHQAQTAQSRKIKVTRQLMAEFIEGIETVQKEHHRQRADLENEFQAEFNRLQKKFYAENQEREYAHVRKSLQSMLF